MMDGDFSCMPLPSPGEVNFEAQAPQARKRQSSNGVLPYAPVIRATTLANPNAIELYTYWKYTGKIYSVQTEGRESLREAREARKLVDAYKYGLERGSGGADFRDAVMDAMAEFIDHRGFWFFPTDSTEGHPNTKMLHFMAFVYALNIYPPEHRFEEDEFRAAFLNELENFPKDKTYRELWDGFMQDGRCRFHEHRTGRCWRAIYDNAA